MDGVQGNPDFNEDCLGRVNVWCWEMDGSRGGVDCSTVCFPRSSMTLHPGAMLYRAWGMMLRDSVPCSSSGTQGSSRDY